MDGRVRTSPAKLYIVVDGTGIRIKYSLRFQELHPGTEKPRERRKKVVVVVM